MSSRNSIIIIEDAEELIVSRDGALNSSISMLLNLTDGLLGACLGIQFICTFNTPLSNIDQALMRKGRLIALYEFKALEPMKAANLIVKLGRSEASSEGAMTLADIYHLDSPGYVACWESRNIGFSIV